MTIHFQRFAVIALLMFCHRLSASGYDFGAQFIRAKDMKASDDGIVVNAGTRLRRRYIKKAVPKAIKGRTLKHSKSKSGQISQPRCDLTIKEKNCAVGDGAPFAPVGGKCEVQPVVSTDKCGKFDPLSFVSFKYTSDKDVLITCTDDGTGDIYVGPKEPFAKMEGLSMHKPIGIDMKSSITCTLADCKDPTSSKTVTFTPKDLQINQAIGDLRLVECGNYDKTTPPLTAYKKVSVGFDVTNNLDFPVTINSASMVPNGGYARYFSGPPLQLSGKSTGTFVGTFEVDTSESKGVLHQALLDCKGVAVASEDLSPAVEITMGEMPL